jgi:hypothetical protein
MFGMWSTLIVMEVIPFLVLAVGVDNMFVLAHALNRQVGCCVGEGGSRGMEARGGACTSITGKGVAGYAMRVLVCLGVGVEHPDCDGGHPLLSSSSGCGQHVCAGTCAQQIGGWGTTERDSDSLLTCGVHVRPFACLT